MHAPVAVVVAAADVEGAGQASAGRGGLRPAPALAPEAWGNCELAVGPHPAAAAAAALPRRLDLGAWTGPSGMGSHTSAGSPSDRLFVKYQEGGGGQAERQQKRHID